MDIENRRKRENEALRIAVDFAKAQGGGKVIRVTEMALLPGHRPGDATSFKVLIRAEGGAPEEFVIARVGGNG